MKQLTVPVLCLLVLFAYGAPLLRGQVQPPTSSPMTTVPGTVDQPAAGAPSQTAVAVTTVPSPASPQHVPEQIEWALAAAYLMQYAKKKGFIPSDTSERVKVFIGGAIAVLTAAGIHVGVSGSFFHGDGAVTITGLSFNAFKDIGFQWVVQQAWYDKVVKKITEGVV